MFSQDGTIFFSREDNMSVGTILLLVLFIAAHFLMHRGHGGHGGHSRHAAHGGRQPAPVRNDARNDGDCRHGNG